MSSFSAHLTCKKESCYVHRTMTNTIFFFCLLRERSFVNFLNHSHFASEHVTACQDDNLATKKPSERLKGKSIIWNIVPNEISILNFSWISQLLSLWVGQLFIPSHSFRDEILLGTKYQYVILSLQHTNGSFWERKQTAYTTTQDKPMKKRLPPMCTEHAYLHSLFLLGP